VVNLGSEYYHDRRRSSCHGSLFQSVKPNLPLLLSQEREMFEIRTEEEIRFVLVFITTFLLVFIGLICFSEDFFIVVVSNDFMLSKRIPGSFDLLSAYLDRLR